MANPLKRPGPGDNGYSGTNITAVVAMLWPFIEPYLTGQETIPVSGDFLSQAAPWIFFGLVALFIRRAIPGKGGADLDRLMDTVQKLVAEREQLKRELRVRLGRTAEERAFCGPFSGGQAEQTDRVEENL